MGPADWLVPANLRHMEILGHTARLGGSRFAWRDADAVIVGPEVASADVYAALLRRRRGVRVGLWGHIKSYVSASSRIERPLERWQLRSADHIFAYTEGGTAYARELGVPSDKITTVMNSVDVSDIVAAMKHDTDLDSSLPVAQFDGKPVLGFIGGLDSSKRVGFLAEALDEIWRRDRRIVVLVAGDGEAAHVLDSAVSRGQVIRLGYADAHIKAAVWKVARAILMPGRIGLIAVEALAMGRPIITTDWPYHAPEREYLSEGVSVITVPDNVVAYAESVIALGQEPPALPESGWSYPTMDDMIANFAMGARKLVLGQ